MRPAPKSHPTNVNDQPWYAFSGRINRLRFVAYQMFVIGIFCAVMCGTILFAGGGSFEKGMQQDSPRYIVFIHVAAVSFLLTYTLTLCVRRLHDIGRSGWIAAFLLLPLVNFPIFLLVFKKGEDSENQYGAPSCACRWWHWLGAIMLPLGLVTTVIGFLAR